MLIQLAPVTQVVNPAFSAMKLPEQVQTVGAPAKITEFGGQHSLRLLALAIAVF